LLHRRAGGGLRSHELDRRRRWPDPHKTGLFHGACERGVLREEAVAGMDCLRSSALGGVQNAIDREVALGRRSRPEEESLVRVRDVERGAIALGIDSDRADAELAEGAEDADRDLPTVGNENLLEHRGPYSLHVVTLTAADQLTVARAASVPIVVALYAWGFSNHNYWATAVFCVAMTTDWFDGRLARKQGRSSSVGSLLDPIADKVLVLAALVMLVGQGIVPAWMVAAIVVREVLITGLRQAAVERGVVLAARDLGKLKTWAQAVAAAVGGFAAAGAWTHRAAWWALLVAVILTWLSGLDYARSAPRLLSRTQTE
jgi:CDP-diacylglycerol--glycerol-3-phosphate 3-phosphatidyltransferase